MKSNTQFNKIINDKENRIKFIAILLIILFCIILLKVLFIYYSGDKKVHNSEVDKYFISNLKKYNILDRRGELLATTVQSYNFYISPAKTVFPENTIAILSTLFPKNTLSEEVLEKIRKKEGRLVLIKREITEEQKNSIITSGIEAGEFEKTFARVYPFANIFSHIIGYVNSSLEGVYGLERSLNEKLYYEDVQTTLDARIQSTIHFKISEEVKKYKAKSGFAIVLNIANGELIGLASLPDFNPKNITDPSGENMKNTAVSQTYNLGSVFKILTIAMGFENKLTETHQFNTKDAIRVDSTFTIEDKTPKPNLRMSEILAFSSNVGTGRILEAVGIENQRPFLEKVGVFTTPKLELSPYEIATPIYQSSKWSKSMHYTASYGYGISLSPIHFANIMRTVIGTGKSSQITLIKNNSSNNEEAVISKETVKKIQQMLKDVINIGTAKQISSTNGYQICGKTSTTYKFDRSIKKWSHTKKMISFLSLFPCSNPQYLIYIGLDEPNPLDGKSYFAVQGGTVIAPMSAELISEIAPILNVKPDLLAE